MPLVTLGGQAFPSIHPSGEGGKNWLSIRDGDLKLTVNKVNFQKEEFWNYGWKINQIKIGE